MPLSQEQLELRKQGITASEIGAVAGIGDPLSQCARPIDVFQSKLGLTEFVENHHVERGTYLEPAVIEWAAQRHLWRVAPAMTVVHPDHPICIATPDGLVADRNKGEGPHAVLEVKCPNRHTECLWGEVGTDQVPDHYRAQVTWQMAATGLRHAYVVAMMAGDIHLYEVAYSQRLFDSLLRVAKRFWANHIEPREPPQPDGSPSYDEYLAKMFPQRPEEDEPEEDASEQAEQLALCYSQANELLRQAKLAHAASKQRLCRYIGGRAGIVGPYGRITYRNNKDSQRTDWKGAAKAVAIPDAVVEKYTNTVQGARVLRAHLEEQKK